MGRRELCICCFQMVTRAQLKKHAEQAAREQRVIAMGGDPSIPDIPLTMKPITGNDIFSPRVRFPAPVLASPAEDSEYASYSDVFVGSPSPVASPRQPIEDDGCQLTPVLGHPVSELLRPLSPDPCRQLPVGLHQDPSPDTRPGGRRPLLQPLLHAAATHESLDFAQGASDFFDHNCDACAQQAN